MEKIKDEQEESNPETVAVTSQGGVVVNNAEIHAP